MLLPGCWGVRTVNKGENVRVRKSLSWASVRSGSSAREPGGFISLSPGTHWRVARSGGRVRTHVESGDLMLSQTSTWQPRAAAVGGSFVVFSLCELCVQSQGYHTLQK